MSASDVFGCLGGVRADHPRRPPRTALNVGVDSTASASLPDASTYARKEAVDWAKDAATGDIID